MGRFVEGYNRLPDGRNIWLVQADENANNHEGWNWSQFFAKLPEPEMEWGGEEWIRQTRSIKRVRDEFRVGDIVVCYQGAPDRAIVGLARIASEGYELVRRRRKPGGRMFDLDWGCRVVPLPLETMKHDPLLSTMEKARMAQGTVFRVSSRELERLLAQTEPTGIKIPDVESALDITWPDEGPTSNAEELERRVLKLLKAGHVPRPSGVQKPKAVERGPSLQYERDPKVRAFVLQEANGVCELCRQPAPFTVAGGFPYLEVHHVRYLARGGPDTAENAVALCPNCHRGVHFGENCAAQLERLRAQVSRLGDGRKTG